MRSLATFALALGLLACSDAQDVATQGAASATCAKATWQAVLPLTSKCASCHGATNPQGNYRTDSYAGVVADAVAGDPGSTLLKTLDPTTGNATHKTLLTATELQT